MFEDAVFSRATLLSFLFSRRWADTNFILSYKIEERVRGDYDFIIIIRFDVMHIPEILTQQISHCSILIGLLLHISIVCWIFRNEQVGFLPICDVL